MKMTGDKRIHTTRRLHLGGAFHSYSSFAPDMELASCSWHKFLLLAFDLSRA